MIPVLEYKWYGTNVMIRVLEFKRHDTSGMIHVLGFTCVCEDTSGIDGMIPVL